MTTTAKLIRMAEDTVDNLNALGFSCGLAFTDRETGGIFRSASDLFEMAAGEEERPFTVSIEFSKVCTACFFKDCTEAQEVLYPYNE
jgi:hypothetical protein